MAYFPLFIELQGAPCLIVGGGRVALRKAQKLLPYGAHLTAVATKFALGWEALPGVVRLARAFCPRDVEGQTLVIAATDDAAQNAAIAAQCRAARVPVNAVDDPESCTFLFPALVRRGALSIGISTGGASPTAAAYLKERIAAQLPEEEAWEAILDYLSAQRPAVKARVQSADARAAAFAALFRACMAHGRPLTDAEREALLASLPEG